MALCASLLVGRIRIGVQQFFTVLRFELLGVLSGHHAVSKFLLDGLTGSKCSLATTICHTYTLFETLRIFLLGKFRSGGFGKHVERNLDVGHVVAKAFFVETFVFSILLCGKSAPLLCDDVGEGGELNAFLNTATFPLVGEVLTHFNGLEALVNPRIGVAKTLVVGNGLVDRFLWILQLFQPLRSDLRHPLLEGFCLRRWDGLDETKNLFGSARLS